MKSLAFLLAAAAVAVAVPPAIDDKTPSPLIDPAVGMPMVVDGDTLTLDATARARCMEESVEWVHNELFGYCAPGTWSMPVGALEEGWLSGDNGFGYHFDLELSFYVETDPQQDGSYAWLWSGALMTDRGYVIADGIGVELPDGTRAIVPLVTQFDQAAAIERHPILVDFMNPDRVMCVLDDLGLAYRQQMRRDASDAQGRCRSRAGWTAAGCLVGGAAACLIVFPVGCVGGILCGIGGLVGTMIWHDDFDREWQRTMEMICVDYEWRRDHPGVPSPFNDTYFDIPEWTIFPFQLSSK